MKVILGEIRKDVEDAKRKNQVIVCTNAAGMGANFAEVNDDISYRPPKDIDTFVQQIGRAGRDGSQSDYVINFSLMSN